MLEGQEGGEVGEVCGGHGPDLSGHLISGFYISDVRSHWEVLSRRETWSDLYLRTVITYYGW